MIPALFHAIAVQLADACGPIHAVLAMPCHAAQPWALTPCVTQLSPACRAMCVVLQGDGRYRGQGGGGKGRVDRGQLAGKAPVHCTLQSLLVLI